MNANREGHRLSKHPLYSKHRNILHRCYNPGCHAFPNYGARGIAMRGDLHDVVRFIDWIGTNLGMPWTGATLERINNDGHYEPGNLRWATLAEQNRNHGHGVVIPLVDARCKLAGCLCNAGADA